MTLQSSGPIKMSEIKAELGSSSNSLRAYSLQAGFSTPDSMTEFLGYSALGSFTYAMAGVSGFSVAQNGTVTAPSLTKGSIASLTYSSGYSANSFGITNTNTVRSVTVVVNIPSGYSNSGTVSGVETYTQTATPTFAFSDWNGSISVVADGSVSYVLGNASSVSVSPSSFAIVNTSTSRTVTVTVTVPSGYYNSGQTVSGTKTATQPSTPSFSFDDWYTGGGSVSVRQNGSVLYSLGQVDAVTVSPTSFPTVSVNTLRDILVTVTVPPGYYNSGGTVSRTVSVTQPLTLSAFTFAMANVTGFAVATDGQVTAPTAQYGGILSRTYSTGYSDGYYTVVGTDTTRSVTVVVTVPSGYSNSGGQVSGVVEAVQLAPPTFAFGNWNGSISVSQSGTVSYVLGNAYAVSVSPTSYGLVNTNTSRTVTVTVTVPAGYYNSYDTVSGTKTVTQQSSPTFAFSDAGVSGFAVGQDGTIYAPSVSAGTISSVSYVGSNSNISYSRVNSNTTRTATVYVTVPGGYYNSGGTVSGTTTATQIASAIFSFSDAGASGFAVAQNGRATPPSVSVGSISSLSYGGTYDTGPHGEITYPLVNTLTQRYVDVYVNVPNGYYNSGETVGGTLYADQSATPIFAFSDWTGGVSVDIDGYASYTTGNAYGVSIAPTYFGKTYTETTRTISVTVTVPGGYYNSYGTVTGTKTATQAASPSDPVVTVYTLCSGGNYFVEGTYYYANLEIGGNCAYYAESSYRSVAEAAGYTEFFSITNTGCTC